MAEILLDFSQEFRALQKRSPVECGNWLCGLKAQGFNQTQMAERLKANRQMIGRYLRIGHWDEEIKSLINQHQVKKSLILQAASKPLSKSELLHVLEIQAPKKVELKKIISPELKIVS